VKVFIPEISKIKLIEGLERKFQTLEILTTVDIEFFLSMPEILVEVVY